MAWIDALLRDGAKVWLTADRFAARFDGRDCGPGPVVVWRRYARPADLARLPATDALVVFERATDTVRRNLGEQKRSWALLDGRYSLPALGLHRAVPVHADPVASRRPPDANAELALLTTALPGATHAELAVALGVSRGRITQLLSRGVSSAVPSPTAGFVTRWWSDATPWEQARAVYDWLDENGCHPVLGGDTAADAVAPWRAPISTFVHVRKIVPPPSGFVVADSHETATVAVVVDYRPSVLSAARQVSTPIGALRVAHPLHIAADLHDTAAVDERVAEQVGALAGRGMAQWDGGRDPAALTEEGVM